MFEFFEDDFSENIHSDLFNSNSWNSENTRELHRNMIDALSCNDDGLDPQVMHNDIDASDLDFDIDNCIDLLTNNTNINNDTNLNTAEMALDKSISEPEHQSNENGLWCQFEDSGIDTSQFDFPSDIENLINSLSEDSNFNTAVDKSVSEDQTVICKELMFQVPTDSTDCVDNVAEEENEENIDTIQDTIQDANWENQENSDRMDEVEQEKQEKNIGDIKIKKNSRKRKLATHLTITNKASSSLQLYGAWKIYSLFVEIGVNLKTFNKKKGYHIFIMISTKGNFRNHKVVKGKI